MKRVTGFLAGAIPALHDDVERLRDRARSEDRRLQASGRHQVDREYALGQRTAVLQGDPSKAGPYAMLLTWLPGNMSRPHFHPNDRFFMVISGTWWVGNGGKFDPEATVPMPAGTHVIHWAKGVHYDGAKTEPATILVWGEGPATSTPFVAAEGTEKK